MGNWQQSMFGLFPVVAAMLVGCSNGGSGGEMWDEKLGAVTWNESTGVWEASVVIARDTIVGISLDTFGEEVDPKLIQKVRDFISQYHEIDTILKKAAAEALLESRNEFWSEGEGDINSEVFIARMSIDGVVFCVDGTAEAYYFDGGLFFGHLIIVPFQDDSIGEAYIAG